MMGELKAVYEVTKQLEEVLNQINDVDRTEMIQQVNELIEQREEIIQRLSKPYSSEEIKIGRQDRKSTRLNSSHVSISYAVFCLKKKKRRTQTTGWNEQC